MDFATIHGTDDGFQEAPVDREGSGPNSQSA